MPDAYLLRLLNQIYHCHRTAREYKAWAAQKQITLVYAESGKPMQNGFIERFNRTFREDILDAYLFSSIRQFNLLAYQWSQDCNNHHPHKSLERKSPR